MKLLDDIKAEIQIWSLYYRTEIVWFIIGFTVGFILGALFIWNGIRHNFNTLMKDNLNTWKIF